jgi:hypothetical protein
MTLESNLKQMERTREAYWLRYPGTSPVKLRWRALAVRHSFHVLPGERILELGAGTGLWAEHLTSVLKGRNPITAAVFDEAFLQTAKKLPNVEFIHVTDLRNDLPAEGFDYIVGTRSFATIFSHRTSRPCTVYSSQAARFSSSKPTIGTRKYFSKASFDHLAVGPATPSARSACANTC